MPEGNGVFTPKINLPAADDVQDFLREHLPQQLQPRRELAGPERKHVGLALLSYDGKIFLRTMMSIISSIYMCGQKGWGFNIINKENDSMVARGRSFLASQFLENPGMKDCTEVVQIDTDLVWGGDELIRLCSHNVDVVGAAYPYKNDGGDFPLRWSPEGIAEENGLWIVQATTPGFLKISRRALERIVLEKPYLQFADRDNPEGQRSWMFFNNEVRQTGVYDEGYVFAEHWRQCGGICYLDPTIELGHIGMKEYRAGTVMDWLDKKKELGEKLFHDHPNIPPLLLIKKAMGDKVDLEEAERDIAYQKYGRSEAEELAEKRAIEIQEDERKGKIIAAAVQRWAEKDSYQVSQKIEREIISEALNGHRNPRKARSAAKNGNGHAAKHQPKRHKDADRGGRGRRGNSGLPPVIAEGLPTNGIDKAP